MTSRRPPGLPPDHRGHRPELGLPQRFREGPANQGWWQPEPRFPRGAGGPPQAVVSAPTIGSERRPVRGPQASPPPGGSQDSIFAEAEALTPSPEPTGRELGRGGRGGVGRDLGRLPRCPLRPARIKGHLSGRHRPSQAPRPCRDDPHPRVRRRLHVVIWGGGKAGGDSRRAIWKGLKQQTAKEAWIGALGWAGGCGRAKVWGRIPTEQPRLDPAAPGAQHRLTGTGTGPGHPGPCSRWPCHTHSRPTHSAVRDWQCLGGSWCPPALSRRGIGSFRSPGNRAWEESPLGPSAAPPGLSL